MVENIKDNVQQMENQGGNVSLSMEYVLTRTDQVLHHTEYIRQALETIGKLAPMEHVDDDRAIAIAQTVAAREETNRKLLSMLGRMYEDLVPRKQDVNQDIEKVKAITELVSSMDMDSADLNEFLGLMIEKVFQGKS